MKNTFKLIGIIALVAVIGFSMAACDSDGGDGGGGGDSYYGGFFTVGANNFIAAFGNNLTPASSGEFKIFAEGDPTLLGDTVYTLYGKSTGYASRGGGFSISQLETALKNSGTSFTADERTRIINKLASDQYVIAAKRRDPDYIDVAFGRKE